MMRSLTVAVAAVAVALASLAASGCLDFERKGSLASPSQISDLKSLLGTWSSASVVPSADSCTEFKWEVTEQSGNTASGNFSATCPGGLKVTGRASGTQLGAVISWTASGTATAPNLPSCAISLTGNAYLEVDRIRVPYSGQTCLGAVKGEEVLTRN